VARDILIYSFWQYIPDGTAENCCSLNLAFKVNVGIATREQYENEVNDTKSPGMPIQGGD